MFLMMTFRDKPMLQAVIMDESPMEKAMGTLNKTRPKKLMSRTTNPFNAPAPPFEIGRGSPPGRRPKTTGRPRECWLGSSRGAVRRAG